MGEHQGSGMTRRWYAPSCKARGHAYPNFPDHMFLVRIKASWDSEEGKFPFLFCYAEHPIRSQLFCMVRFPWLKFRVPDNYCL